MDIGKDNGSAWYYLFASPAVPPVQVRETVFYKVQGLETARSLCRLFTREYSATSGSPAFDFLLASSLTSEDQILFDEVLDWLGLYRDPDPYVYDPPPPEDMHGLAQLAVRAEEWEEMLRARTQKEEPESEQPSAAERPPLAKLQHVVEKHRLIFLFFARPKRRNPTVSGKWETFDSKDLPQNRIPGDAIDPEGAFLFKHEYIFNRFAQAVVSQFGPGEGAKPADCDQDGKWVEVEGGSLPVWAVDDDGCIFLESSSDAVLDACKMLARSDSSGRHNSLIRKVRGITHDEGQSRWYSSVLVRWIYLSRLDAVISDIKAAELDLHDGSEQPCKSRTDSTGPTQMSEPGMPEQPVPKMPEDERRNSGLVLFMLLAQVYYKLLESTMDMHCGAVDLPLNHSYLWVVNSISTLLQNHPDLQDFPSSFEPLVPNIYPSTIRDMDWQEDAAPHVEGFLASVQEYAQSKGMCDPERGSAGWAFVELYRPGVNTALEQASQYRKKMRQYMQKALDSVGKKLADTSPESAPSLTRPSLDASVGPGASARQDLLLTKAELHILRAFAAEPGRCMTLADAMAAGGYGKAVTSQSLRRLREQNLITKPPGTSRKGDAITAAGAAFLDGRNRD